MFSWTHGHNAAGAGLVPAVTFKKRDAPDAERVPLSLLAFRATAGKMSPMKNFTAVIERDKDTGLLVGFVPGFSGAHSQGATLNELRDNLAEVLAMLLEDGEPVMESEFVGTQNFTLA